MQRYTTCFSKGGAVLEFAWQCCIVENVSANVCVSLWGNQIILFSVPLRSDRALEAGIIAAEWKKWMNRWIKPLLSFISCSNPSLAQNTHRDKHTLQLSHFQSQALWVLSHTLTLSVLFLNGRESKWFRTVWSFFNKLILTKAHANTCMCGCMCTLAVESWSVVVSTSQYFLSAIV